MTKKEKIQLVYDCLYEMLNESATGVSLDGNVINFYVDGEFECKLEIKVNTIKVFDDEEE